MAVKAADFLGADEAIAAFNAGDNWRDGDLHVFLFDKIGTWGLWGAARAD